MLPLFSFNAKKDDKILSYLQKNLLQKYCGHATAVNIPFFSRQMRLKKMFLIVKIKLPLFSFDSQKDAQILKVIY